MAASHPQVAPKSLERRLMSDIAEIQQDPYPNVHLHFDDANIRKACLILTPEDEDSLHLTIAFHHDYPLHAPTVTIQSRIEHPNVHGSYVCASILNSTEGWTPAYTLRGIVIQLLSFFCSDSIEQDYGDITIDLASYRRRNAGYRRRNGQQLLSPDWYSCHICGFGPDWMPSQSVDMGIDEPAAASTGTISVSCTTPRQKHSKLFKLPDEVVLIIFAGLDTRDILAFADAVPSVKRMVYSYDFIRIRELQCFCLKKSFMDAKLGIGVTVVAGSWRPVFRSEFDLLSQEAFYQHGVRHSIQGVAFEKWLPLPLSRHHWNRVKTNAVACIEGLHNHGKMENKEHGAVDVLYHFMNNVVVQFSADAEKGYHRSNPRSTLKPDSRSTLNHASEKSVEAYFGLYHLLLCLATEDRVIVVGANEIISRFIAGPRSKARFPDLGHVLVAALIADAGLTEELTFLIIKEAILRNVVWMLDAKGAGFAELAYLEPTAISEYRLANTFAASPTSYRLLMFLKLFSSTARPPNKSLSELRDSLFDTHGAPPPGTSAMMAQRIRKIRDIDSFPGFLAAMGIKRMPNKTEFTSFLRRTIGDSVAAGYSCIPMSQSKLYMIRKIRERSVEATKDVNVNPALERWFEAGEKWYNNGWNGRPSFFPGHGIQNGVHRGSGGHRGGNSDGGGGRGGFRGRGRRFGRGRGG
jgi:ubiquitin-protein ligase